MKTFKAPEPFDCVKGKTIFLAGTIDMGNSENWQEEVTRFFENRQYTILNPRRDDWDNSWKQTADDEKFSEQVNWELNGLEKADIIVMNFLAGSQSPVTMLELGLNAGSGKLRVCCPKEFWRSGNIHIVCKRYNIPLYTSMQELLDDIEN